MLMGIKGIASIFTAIRRSEEVGELASANNVLES